MYLAGIMACSLAALWFALRLRNTGAGRSMPVLQAWAWWSVTAFAGSFALNLYDQRLYSRLWRYREPIDLALLALAALEIFLRTCSSVRGGNDLKSGLFLFAALVSIVAGGLEIWFRWTITGSESTLLLFSHAGSLTLAIFVGIVLLFAKFAAIPNLSIHAKLMGVYLATWAASRLLCNFTVTSVPANLTALFVVAGIFGAWAYRLRTNGEIKIKRGFVDGPDHTAAMQRVARETLEQSRAS
jgi:hypothetical protein